MAGAAGDPRPRGIPRQPGSVPGLTPAMPGTALPGLSLALRTTKGSLKWGFPISRALPWGNPGSKSILELGGVRTPTSTPRAGAGVRGCPSTLGCRKQHGRGCPRADARSWLNHRGHTWGTDALAGSGSDAEAAVDLPNRPHGLPRGPHTPHAPQSTAEKPLRALPATI